MKKANHTITYDVPTDNEIIQAYFNKRSYNRTDARKLKRALRKLKALNEYSI